MSVVILTQQLLGNLSKATEGTLSRATKLPKWPLFQLSIEHFVVICHSPNHQSVRCLSISISKASFVYLSFSLSRLFSGCGMACIHLFPCRALGDRFVPHWRVCLGCRSNWLIEQIKWSLTSIVRRTALTFGSVTVPCRMGDHVSPSHYRSAPANIEC